MDILACFLCMIGAVACAIMTMVITHIIIDSEEYAGLVLSLLFAFVTFAFACGFMESTGWQVMEEKRLEFTTYVTPSAVAIIASDEDKMLTVQGLLTTMQGAEEIKSAFLIRQKMDRHNPMNRYTTFYKVFTKDGKELIELK